MCIIMHMQTLDTLHIATITELREPMKVLEAANGQPVAILKNNLHVATLTPVHTAETPKTDHISVEDALNIFESSKAVDQPVYDYLRTR